MCAHGEAGAGHGGDTNFVDQQQFNAFQINIQNQINLFQQQFNAFQINIQNQINLFQQQNLQTLDNIQIRLHALDGQ